MRPRISQLEAQFILETLLTRKEEIQALVTRREQLSHEVYRLRQELFYDPMVALREGYREKKEELEKLESETMRIHFMLKTYDSLIAKYQLLAEGSKHKGRYKHEATQHLWLISQIP